MVALVGRDQAIHVAVEDDGLEAIVGLDGLLAELDLVVLEVAALDVEAQLAHARHIDAELDARLLVPSGDVGALRLGGIDARETILDVETLDGVGVVAGPELGEVAQCLIVDAPATARAQHHGQVGVLGPDALEHAVQAAHIVDIEVLLLVLEMGREDVGDGTVAIPLEEGYLRIGCHEPVDHAEHMVLHLRVAQVQHHPEKKA